MQCLTDRTRWIEIHQASCKQLKNFPFKKLYKQKKNSILMLLKIYFFFFSQMFSLRYFSFVLVSSAIHCTGFLMGNVESYYTVSSRGLVAIIFFWENLKIASRTDFFFLVKDIHRAYFFAFVQKTI